MTSKVDRADEAMQTPVSVALSVVVVTYNSAGVIETCLGSLPEAVGDAAYEVLMVDNSSSDGTVGLVRDRYPGTRVIGLPENIGFAGANNVALDAARGRYLLLLNPDTAADPGSLRRMIAFLDASPEVGVVAPRLVNADGSDQGTARSFPTPANALFGRRSVLTRLFPHNPWSTRYLLGSHIQDVEALEVDWVSGACLMVRREAVTAVGNLDAGYFMYWEDADWCRRIKDAGFRIYSLREPRVVHDEGAARGVSVRQVWEFHRSAYRYAAKHLLKDGLWVLRPLAAIALIAHALAVLGMRLLRLALGRGR